MIKQLAAGSLTCPTVAVIGLLAVALPLAAPAFGQSLADAARKEEERRKAVKEPAKVYTNGDLKGSLPQPAAPPPAAIAPEVVVPSAQDAFSPARYRDGMVPPLPVLALGGGQVFLELTVGSDGRVTAVTPMRTTPPFTDLVVDAVRGWQFRPAEEGVEPKAGEATNLKRRQRVASKVLVAGLFRPPSINTPTLGEAPRDVASGSDETPFPVATAMPPFPPLAINRGVVLVEARTNPSGAVADVRVIRSAPPFDEVARAAARQWRFRPARVGGQSVAAFVYILFGFPQPEGPPPSPTTSTSPDGAKAKALIR